ncbi:MAG: DEAD/DEAH box helicase [Verrucomicrobia bacterium]|nr:DEAD/DEAH box helicase [Verrucomicrobiota bacterium]MBI3868105.1 DEAD/DEAH box helicase [Verrucomicrobiota bacterium]
MAFGTFGLAAEIMEGVKAMGYVEPTPIQLRAIPLLLEDKDLIGSAQTGTGKTAAFALPMLSKLLACPRKVHQMLILEPTRELAAQVETALHDFTRFTNLKTGVFYGGVGYGKQREALQEGVEILVATPGRLLDHIQQKALDLSHIRYLVLDEADRMLDMGFLPDVRRIVERCPRQRQTALFSATIPAQIETLIQWAMRSPETVEIGMRRSPAETVKHVVYPVSDFQKEALLLELLHRVDFDSVIVFCRTKSRADHVSAVLKQKRHAVAVLHSNRTQQERQRALQGFREGRYEVLVATDIASRGLDIADVTHVINFDVPQHPEDYVHRIGRTGRAQATGDALTIMVAEDRQPMEAIERFIGQKIERVKLERFDYKYTSLFEADQRPAHETKFRAVRLSGGYFFGPSKRRR